MRSLLLSFLALHLLLPFSVAQRPTRAPEAHDSEAAPKQTDNEVFMEAIVEERPSVLSAPKLVYPDVLRQAGIQGRVLVQAVIDTTGRAEANSVKVLQSPNPGFDQNARNYVLKARFRPARIHGRAVRVLVQVPVDFAIDRH